jgi:hypothetical protein
MLPVGPFSINLNGGCWCRAIEVSFKTSSSDGGEDLAART